MHDDFRLHAALNLTAPDDGPRRFTMTAYDGGLLQLPNVPVPVVVDLSGVRQADQVKALLHHDPSRPVGHMERVDVGTRSIETEGVLSVPENARAIEAAQKNGFSWEASIGAQILDKELIPRGNEVTVNGRTFQGPVLVARKTLLREVSFTGAGAGHNTSATIAAQMAAQPLPDDYVMPETTPAKTPDDQTPDIERELAGIREVRASLNSELEQVRAERQRLQEERDLIQRERLSEAVDRFANQYRVEDDQILAELRQQASSGEIAENEIELTLLRASRAQLDGLQPAGSGRRAPASPHIIEAALHLNSGWEENELDGLFDQETINAALGREWQGFGIHALGVEYLQSRGHHVLGGKLSDDDIKTMIRMGEDEPTQIRAAGGFSTLSLPGILSNVARKELLRGYDAFNRAITTVAKRATATDYKPFFMYRIHTGGLLEQVGADGELKSMELKEDEYQSRVYPWGRKLSITSVMFKNDDAGAFRDLARLFGLTASRTVERQGFAVLLSDEANFWTQAKGNRLAAGAGSALGLDSVKSAFDLFLKAKDSTGQPVGLRPKTLLTGSQDFVTAMDINRHDRINLAVRDGGSSGEIIERTAANSFRGMFDPQYSPYLDNNAVPNANGTQWLLVTDPAVTAPIVIAYLDGRSVPSIRPWDALPGKMGMQWDISMSFGFNLHDDVSSVFSPGQ